MALVASESYIPEDLMSNMVGDLEPKAEESEPENVIRRLLSIAKMELAPTISLTSITKLDLFQSGLSELPTCLSSHLPNLSILFCMKNTFTEMPAVIGSCPKLQMVSFKSNQIRSIHPEALQPQMRWLILTDNEIKSIPSTIGRCKLLQKFMLSGNNLSDLPDEIGMCHNLELIRLASNQLKEVRSNILCCIVESHDHLWGSTN
jgi:Leucine-rich repeat (LRR) protein